MEANSKSSEKKPDCFGILDNVFPMTDSGLRQTPDSCFENCPIKTQCLAQAMSSQKGLEVEKEIVKRGEKSGTINFFERWSRKKQIHNQSKIRR